MVFMNIYLWNCICESDGSILPMFFFVIMILSGLFVDNESFKDLHQYGVMNFKFASFEVDEERQLILLVL